MRPPRPHLVTRGSRKLEQHGNEEGVLFWTSIEEQEYIQQGYSGEARFETRLSLRIAKYFDSLTVHTVEYCRDTVE